MSLRKSTAILKKMITTMMMGQMRLKRNNLATDSLNRFIKQIKSQNQMKKKKKKEIENREKGVHKKRFIKYFSNEPTTLVNN